MRRPALVALLLLAACAAPPPSSAPRAGAPDAPIAPIASLAPPRPLLFVDRSPRGLATRAVHADGTPWKHSIDSIGAAWSPRGGWFTEVWGYVNLNLRNLVGDAKIVYSVPRFGTRLWERAAWSPDGARVCVVELAPDFRSAALVIVELEEAVLREPVVEVAKRLRHARHLLPAGSAGGRGLYAIPGNAFSWSPDGQKILLAWDQVVVFHTSEARFETVVDGAAVAEWSPGSEGVYYVDVGLPAQTAGEKPDALARGRAAKGVHYRALGGAPARQLLDEAALNALDLAVTRGPFHPWGVTLARSPLGDRLLLTGSTRAGDAGRLLVYDLIGAPPAELRRPALDLRAPGKRILAAEWSPSDAGVIGVVTATDVIEVQSLHLEGGWRALYRTAFKLGEMGGAAAQLTGVDLLSW